jgi:5-oxoprolinase (ATP-hydrolysing)
MSFAVSYQSKHLQEAGEGGWEEGDVVLTNHPIAGGRYVNSTSSISWGLIQASRHRWCSHLPDITAITPVFSPELNEKTGKKEILFFTASRAHHADVSIHISMIPVVRC